MQGFVRWGATLRTNVPVTTVWNCASPIILGVAHFYTPVFTWLTIFISCFGGGLSSQIVIPSCTNWSQGTLLGGVIRLHTMDTSVALPILLLQECH